MPLFFSIAIQGALEEVATILLLEEQLCAFLDDVYALRSPDRVKPIREVLARALHRVAGIRVHQGKTSVWNKAQPEDVDSLGENVWQRGEVTVLGGAEVVGGNPKSAGFTVCMVDLVAKRQPEIEPHIAHAEYSHMHDEGIWTTVQSLLGEIPRKWGRSEWRETSGNPSPCGWEGSGWSQQSGARTQLIEHHGQMHCTWFPNEIQLWRTRWRNLCRERRSQVKIVWWSFAGRRTDWTGKVSGGDWVGRIFVQGTVHQTKTMESLESGVTAGNIGLLPFLTRRRKLTMLLGRTAARRAHIRSHSGRNAGVALAHCPTGPEFTIHPICSGHSCWKGCACHNSWRWRVVKAVTRDWMSSGVWPPPCFLHSQWSSEEESHFDRAHGCSHLPRSRSKGSAKRVPHGHERGRQCWLS